MRGLAIFAALLVGIGVCLFWLFRPSHRDLERVETEIAAELARARASLTDATQALQQLRAIKPNIGLFDAERDRMRDQVAALDGALERFRAERPEESAARATLVDARRRARAGAADLAAAAARFARLARLLDAFMRDTQPAVKRLIEEHVARLFLEKNRLEQAGKPLDAGLALKVEQLRKESWSARDLARQVFEIGPDDVDQAETLVKTVAAEVARLAADVQAMTADLQRR